jgi:hypothetical protein
MLAGVMLPHPTAQSVLGTALHVFLRNALRTAAFPTLGLSLPGGVATFRAPAFQHTWWLALGWSLAEVAAGVAQGYETLTLYRDALVPEGRARELVTSAVTAPAWEPKTDRNQSLSPPRVADERLRESLSRGEDGGVSMDIAGSPVRGRRLEPSFTSIQIGNDAETQLEVDRDFDELIAVKAREELEDLYGFAPIVSFFPSMKDKLLIVPPTNCSTCPSSSHVCCASRRYSCPSALSYFSRRGILPRPSPRLLRQKM